MPNIEQTTNIISRDKKINVTRWIVYSFLGVSVIFTSSTIVIFRYWDTLEHSGLFGDTFGSINAFFSALAFAGVIVAILLQRKELEFQREELEQTREEFQRQTKEFEEQNQTLSIQRFESTFFSMLNLLISIVNGMHYKRVETTITAGGFNSNAMTEKIHKHIIEQQGRNVFSYFRERLLDELRSVALSKTAFKTTIHNFIFNKPEEANVQLAHYFKTVYSALKFIETSSIFNLNEKRKYINILRAQLSHDELFLLLCNCAYNKEFIPFKLLLEKYSILKHFYLNVDDAEIWGILESEFQPRAFKKNDEFDVHKYDDILNSQTIANYIE